MNIGLQDVANRILRILTEPLKLPSRQRTSTSIPAAPATGFQRYRDPAGRFELSHPAEWVVEEVDGLHLHSPAMGSFARVQEAVDDPWPALAEAFQAAGGRFILERRKPGRAWGRLEAGGRSFGWDATLRGGFLLLLGNVADPARGAALERYEDRALAAIRRSFKV